MLRNIWIAPLSDKCNFISYCILNIHGACVACDTHLTNRLLKVNLGPQGAPKLLVKLYELLEQAV